MFKRIAILTVLAGVALAPAAAQATPLPAIGPIKPIQVKWIFGPGLRRLRRGRRVRDDELRRPQLPRTAQPVARRR